MARPTREQFLDKIERLIRSRKLIMFCGAGISVTPPSNLPLAKELRDNILEKLLRPDDWQHFKERFAEKPLESVIEIVDRNSKEFLPSLRRLFQSAQPNRNHLLLAKLVTEEYLQTIMTTNFDTLLEEALRQEGMTDFQVYLNEDHFAAIEVNDMLRPSIVKIHGTIDDLASVRSALNQIAMRARSEARKRALSVFFCDLHKDVLILGYGVKDEFDINPALRSLKTTTAVYHVEHDSEDIFEINSLENPLAQFQGERVRCNTQLLLDSIQKRIFEKNQSHKQNGFPQWRRFLDEWATCIDSGTKLFISADLMELIEALPEARKTLLDCMSIWSRDEYKKMGALLNLGSIEERMTSFPEAEKHFKACLDIAQRLGDNMTRARCLQHIGQLAYQKVREGNEESDQGRAQLALAIEFTRKSHDIFQREGENRRRDLAVIYHQYGMIYSSMKLYCPAEANLRKSIRISTDLGDIEGQIASLAQLGLLYTRQGRTSETIQVLGEARSLAILLAKEDMIRRIDSDLKKAIEMKATPRGAVSNRIDLQTLLLPTKRYCCVTIERLSAVSRMRYTFDVGIILRNKSGRDLDIEFVEVLSDGVGFSNGVTYMDRKTLVKSDSGGTVKPNGVLTLEWGEKYETSETSASPTFARWKLLAKLKEMTPPLEYSLDIPSSEFRLRDAR